MSLATSRNWVPSPFPGNTVLIVVDVPFSTSASCRPSAKLSLAAARSGLPPSMASIAATAALRASAADWGEIDIPDRPRLAPGGITLGAPPPLWRNMAGDDTDTAPSVSLTPKTSSSRPPHPPDTMFCDDPVCACSDWSE